jgi:rare lipoprotein A
MALLVLACGVAQAQAEPTNAEREAATTGPAVDAGAVTAAAAAASVGAAAAAAAVDEAIANVSEPTAEVGPPLQTGIASWYGRQFHGRKTASGERFDMDALTAAHPKLPFGSWVRVRNLFNGRSVDVRINDRGPYIKRRIIDLSRAAAEVLGLMGAGTRGVELTLLKRQ